MHKGKRFTAALGKVDRRKDYELSQAVVKMKETATAKFDETVEVTINLGIDPRKSDQMIRGSVTLPNGTGKSVRLLVLCKEDKAKEALAAGADMAGLEEYIEKIQGGWLDIDQIVATPDVMPQVGKVGKILGPRGLMPNPKTGSVTADVATAVKEVKGGRIAFRVDKLGILHIPFGKASFEAPKLLENVQTVIAAVQRLKPPTAKGQFMKRITLSSTMGPGIRVDRSSALAGVK